MTRDPIFVATLACALGCALIGGVFFAFSSFVMKALRRLPPAQGIAAMQAINFAVLNPSFFTASFGTAALCVPLAASSPWRWSEPGTILRLLGSAAYLAGTILVTMACNVPRNNALARVDPTSAEGARLWAEYLRGWTAWNHVRTAAGVAAAAALILALCA